MGAKYLTPIRLKIMAILKLALRFKDDFPDLCVASWDSFVHNIEVECLGPMLGQIVATILPLLGTCPEQIVAIFTFLAVENKYVIMVSFFLCEYAGKAMFISGQKLMGVSTDIVPGSLNR